MERSLATTAITRQSNLLLAAARSRADALEAAVPTCPGWDVGELVKHVGRIYAWCFTIVNGRLVAPPDRSQLPQKPDSTSLLDWLEQRRDLLVVELDAVPDEVEVWNFLDGGPAPVEFWWRRQLHETLIHRVDAEAAVGAPISDVEPEIAADGVTELLEFARLARADDLGDDPGLTVHLHASDRAGAEWTIGTAAGRFTLAHAKGDAALRGPAWALDRWLWSRPADGDVEVFGEIAAAESWRDAISR